MDQDFTIEKVAVIGGTGDLGFGLAIRLAMAGYEVTIGSRTAVKAAEAAERVRAICAERDMPGALVKSDDNLGAALACDTVVLAVPYASQAATLAPLVEALSGKILISASVPLIPPKVARVQLPVAGSAAQEAQAQLGDGVEVISAFQNVAAAHLQGKGNIDCDVLVTGNSVPARSAVVAMIKRAGMTGLHAGRLENAAAAEALTSVLIAINGRYKCQAGLRITGLPDSG